MYNSELWIEKCLHSVQVQSYANFEILVINDGSKDSSRQIVQNIAKNDLRIRLIDKENGGYCSAINCGLDNLSKKSDYFLLLGSDDTLLPGALESLADCSSNNNYPDIVGFKTSILDEKGNIKIDNVTNSIDSVIYEKQININNFLEKYKEASRILCQRDTSKIYKTGLLKSQRYFGKYGIDADGIFAMLFCQKCLSFLLTPIIGYNWFVRTDSVSQKGSSLRVNKDRLKNWKLFLKHTDAANKIFVRLGKKMVRKIRIYILFSPVLALFFKVRRVRRNKRKEN